MQFLGLFSIFIDELTPTGNFEDQDARQINKRKGSNSNSVYELSLCFNPFLKHISIYLSIIGTAQLSRCLNDAVLNATQT